jgi:hypothetical protein
VLAALDGRLKYSRTADGVTLRTFYQCQPRSVAFSPDGHLLVVAGSAALPSLKTARPWSRSAPMAAQRVLASHDQLLPRNFP